MDYNALHPYPRYGAAVALQHANKRSPAEAPTAEALAPLVAQAIEDALARYSVHTHPIVEGTETLTFDWVKDPEPGSKTGQVASKGYYLAPHVVTSDGSALGLLKTASALAAELRAGEPLDKPVELTRTFAPLVAKVNAGTASPSNPKTTRINAALTALATVTPDKAAAWSLGNAALIPDLPLVERDGSSPLLDYVWLFAHMSGQFYDSAAAMQTPLAKDGGYKRPRLHEGNFPEAPSSSALGALGVAASVGWWARHGETLAVDDPEGWARRVLTRLAERPLLVVSYDGTRQERFGHHVVGLALDGDLKAAMRALWTVLPFGFVDWNDKSSQKKVELFRLMADRFLRLFTRPALRDFLATRAAYPAALAPVFETYFTHHAMLSLDLVRSARAYGETLNTAAYYAAVAEATVDEKRRGEDKARTPEEYKQRLLVEFESAVQSAKSGPELLAKVGSRAGRLAGFEMPPEASEFMDAVASWNKDPEKLALARDLVTAFMRIRKEKRSRALPTASVDSAPTATPSTDPLPDDLV